jgi:DNA-binding transcriptional MerR regulator
MYSMGQFSKLTGVTAKALYLYEQRGLLTPRRSHAGYRRYTARELMQLERIVALKGLGLSVGSAAQGAFIDTVKLASLSPGKRLRSQALLSS